MKRGLEPEFSNFLSSETVRGPLFETSLSHGPFSRVGPFLSVRFQTTFLFLARYPEIKKKDVVANEGWGSLVHRT